MKAPERTRGRERVLLLASAGVSDDCKFMDGGIRGAVSAVSVRPPLRASSCCQGGAVGRCCDGPHDDGALDRIRVSGPYYELHDPDLFDADRGTG